jgi:hypothetical protein
LAEQINTGTLLVLIEVFFVYCVEFVSKHVKVILVEIRNRKLTFFWKRAEYLLERKRSGQDLVVELLFCAFKGSHKLSVSNQVVFVLFSG